MTHSSGVSRRHGTSDLGGRDEDHSSPEKGMLLAMVGEQRFYGASTIAPWLGAIKAQIDWVELQLFASRKMREPN